MSRVLPARLPSHLLRLNHSYNHAGKALERDIIAASRFYIEEDVAFDNWNGGTHGHDVTFFLPLEELARIGIDEQAEVAQSICADLNKLAPSGQNEFYNAVHLELADESDPFFQLATPFASKPAVNPDSLTIWKKGLGRVFISHRDEHKAAARELADALEAYGLSSFVAHETIPANEEWQKVIVNGLETMEVMVLFVTDDFDQSVWTMQEVGYALGKGTPIISLKLGKKDPPGFVHHRQGLKGSIDHPFAAAQGLFPLIGKALGKQERLQDILISSFIESPNWSDTKVRFDRMAKVVDKLTPAQLKRIIEGFADNDQLFHCIHLVSKHERLKKFLERTTGDKFEIDGNRIKKLKRPAFEVDDDEMPF